jgi:hypothetical protein
MNEMGPADASRGLFLTFRCDFPSPIEGFVTPDLTHRLTYDEWRALLDHELGVRVVDDEGRRRCERDLRLGLPLTRPQAEAYYAFNSFIRTPEMGAT